MRAREASERKGTRRPSSSSVFLLLLSQTLSLNSPPPPPLPHRVHRPSNDAAERVPRLIVEPVPEAVERRLREELGHTCFFFGKRSDRRKEKKHEIVSSSRFSSSSEALFADVDSRRAIRRRGPILRHSSSISEHTEEQKKGKGDEARGEEQERFSPARAIPLNSIPLSWHAFSVLSHRSLSPSLFSLPPPGAERNSPRAARLRE